MWDSGVDRIGAAVCGVEIEVFMLFLLVKWFDGGVAFCSPSEAVCLAKSFLLWRIVCLSEHWLMRGIYTFYFGVFIILLFIFGL